MLTLKLTNGSPFKKNILMSSHLLSHEKERNFSHMNKVKASCHWQWKTYLGSGNNKLKGLHKRWSPCFQSLPGAEWLCTNQRWGTAAGDPSWGSLSAWTPIIHSSNLNFFLYSTLLTSDCNCITDSKKGLPRKALSDFLTCKMPRRLNLSFKQIFLQQESVKTEEVLPYLRHISAWLHSNENHRDDELLNIYHPPING